MAIAFRIAGSSNVSGTAPIVPNPGVVDGDLILIAVATDTVHDRGVATTLNGFTDHGAYDDTSGDTSLTLLTKIASGEPGTWTFTGLFLVSESGLAVCASWSGVDTTTPLDGIAIQDSTSGSTTAQSWPTITPNTANARVIAVGGADPGANPRSITPTAPAVERFDGQNALVGYVCILEQSGGSPPTATTIAGTLNGADVLARRSFALRPAASVATSSPFRRRRNPLLRR
jgi:hypothetical protein